MIKISPSLSISVLDGEAVLLDQASGRYFGLNAVGTRIFALFQTWGDLELVAKSLVEEFDIPEATLRRDLDLFVKNLTERNLIFAEP